MLAIIITEVASTVLVASPLVLHLLKLVLMLMLMLVLVLVLVLVWHVGLVP